MSGLEVEAEAKVQLAAFIIRCSQDSRSHREPESNICITDHQSEPLSASLYFLASAGFSSSFGGLSTNWSALVSTPDPTASQGCERRT